MRQVYEQRAANPHEAKKVNELEDELQKTKVYYHNRIKELEDKYRYGGAPPQKTTANQQADTPLKSNMSQAEAQELQERVIELEQKNAQLYRERNHFADKLV